MTEGRITLVVEDPLWRKSRGLQRKLTAAAKAGLAASGLPRDARITVLLADDERLRALNQAFRGKDKPTNVLSFPAAPNREGYAGDIALAYGVTRAEARAAGKTIAGHAAHLVVHGVLHLAGFDHEEDSEAERMEGLEVKILSRLGIADPYKEHRPGKVRRRQQGRHNDARDFPPRARNAPPNKWAHSRPGRATVKT